jgi:hypothetical protein
MGTRHLSIALVLGLGLALALLLLVSGPASANGMTPHVNAATGGGIDAAPKGLTVPGISAVASGSGNCLDFDGSGDYAGGSGITSTLSTITLEAWVYHRTLPAAVQRYVTVDSEVAVIRRNSAGELHFYIKTDGSLHSILVDDALETERWYHVAGTWDGTDMKLYLNGELVGQDTPGGSLTAPSGGVSLSSSGETMDGYVDDVRIWNDARTQAEIRANMHTELGGSESGLEHYWRLNESSGTTAYDSAGAVDLTLSI